MKQSDWSEVQLWSLEQAVDQTIFFLHVQKNSLGTRLGIAKVSTSDVEIHNLMPAIFLGLVLQGSFFFFGQL